MIAIRPYDLSDTARLLEIWHAASLVGHPFLSEEFLVTERGMMEHTYLPNAETWVAEVDRVAVGFVSMAGDEIGGLFVDPAFHGHGAGRTLVEHVKSGRDSLELTVFERNAVGRRFYDAAGFTVVERRISEVEAQPEIRMRLDLTARDQPGT